MHKILDQFQEILGAGNRWRKRSLAKGMCGRCGQHPVKEVGEKRFTLCVGCSEYFRMLHKSKQESK